MIRQLSKQRRQRQQLLAAGGGCNHEGSLVRSPRHASRTRQARKALKKKIPPSSHPPRAPICRLRASRVARHVFVRVYCSFSDVTSSQATHLQLNESTIRRREICVFCDVIIIAPPPPLVVALSVCVVINYKERDNVID